MHAYDPARVQRLGLFHPDTWFATVDPGLRNPAYSLFRGGRLVAASRVKVPKAVHELDRAERCRQVSLLIAAAIRTKMAELGAGGARLACVAVEWPQIYQHGRSKGDPNDLLPLAGIDVGLACELDVEVVSPTPHEWIGTIKKSETGDPWDSARGMLVQRRTTPEERAAIVASHDAIDAAALGLKVLGRLERSMPGTT